ncbi:hypothetical protein JCM11491_002555 [Sporobolomyces phaffii]
MPSEKTPAQARKALRDNATKRLQNAGDDLSKIAAEIVKLEGMIFAEQQVEGDLTNTGEAQARATVLRDCLGRAEARLREVEAGRGDVFNPLERGAAEQPWIWAPGMTPQALATHASSSSSPSHLAHQYQHVAIDSSAQHADSGALPHPAHSAQDAALAAYHGAFAFWQAELEDAQNQFSFAENEWRLGHRG